MAETSGAKWIRGLVKTVFILCFVAFMWASIRHVATYFNSFEPNGGDWAGSYMLAGAFDITALVTTIGVMFFRKSMPKYIQIIVWVFIIAIAGYSFFINWEYSAHFQNVSLTLQPTGATTPVYDQQGNLHYVPVMTQNIALLYVNPFLASGFTIFSLIYSVVAEFFGTKQQTVAELQERQTYLEQTQSIRENIKQLEEKDKGKSLIQKAKDAAKEGKDAWNELRKKDEIAVQSQFNLLQNGAQIEQQSRPNLAEISSQSQGDLTEIGLQSRGNLAPDLNQISGQSQSNLTQDLGQNSMQSQDDLVPDLSQILSQSQNDLGEITRQSRPRTDPDLVTVYSAISSQSQERTTGDLPANSVQSRRRITQDLSKIDVQSQPKQYAITKKDAASRLHCSVKEIEQSIQDGGIKTYGNNLDKVLISSLKNFVPAKRRLKIVNG